MNQSSLPSIECSLEHPLQATLEGQTMYTVAGQTKSNGAMRGGLKHGGRTSTSVVQYSRFFFEGSSFSAGHEN